MKKRVVILILFVATITSGYGQRNLEAFFERYADDERFTYVSIGKGAFNMVQSLGLFDEISELTKEVQLDDKNFVSNIIGLKILSLETKENEKEMKNIIDDINKITSNPRYESIVEVREKQERTSIFLAKDKTEMVIFTRDKSEMSIIWLLSKKK